MLLLRLMLLLGLMLLYLLGLGWLGPNYLAGLAQSKKHAQPVENNIA